MFAAGETVRPSKRNTFYSVMAECANKFEIDDDRVIRKCLGYIRTLNSVSCLQDARPASFVTAACDRLTCGSQNLLLTTICHQARYETRLSWIGAKNVVVSGPAEINV